VDVAAKENPGQRFLIVALLEAPDQRKHSGFPRPGRSSVSRLFTAAVSGSAIDSFGGNMKRISLFLCGLALAAPLSCMAAADAGGAPGPVALTVSLPDPGQKILYVH
jgi:hypothetical protein